MHTSFDQLMRQADLLSIAERALGLGESTLYDELIHDASAWNYEVIARHLSELRHKVVGGNSGLETDIDTFLAGVPLTPAS